MNNSPFLLDDLIVLTLVQAIRTPRLLSRHSPLRLLTVDLVKTLHQVLVGPPTYFREAYNKIEESLRAQAARFPRQVVTYPQWFDFLFKRKTASYLLRVAKGDTYSAFKFLDGFASINALPMVPGRDPAVPMLKLDVYISGLERQPNKTAEHRVVDGCVLLALLATIQQRTGNDVERYSRQAMMLLDHNISVPNLMVIIGAGNLPLGFQQGLNEQL